LRVFSHAPHVHNHNHHGQAYNNYNNEAKKELDSQTAAVESACGR
jgi:hypothetical protein